MTQFANWFLLPPSGPLLLVLLGLLLHRIRPGRALVVLGALLLYLFSLPMVSYALMAQLQKNYWPPDLEGLGDAEAIVVLGAGYRSGAEEYSGETVNALALVRLRYAAYLHRQTGLPVVASGGAPEQGPDDLEPRVPEAIWMAEVLQEFGVESPLIEDQSRDTWGNAEQSAALLEALGIRRVALVSHAHHMPRAVWSFRQAGLEVVPAPTGAFVPRDTALSLGSFRPQATALYNSWLATHEYLGILWYRWQYGRA